MTKINTNNTIHPIQQDQIILFGDSITQYSFDPFNSGFGAILSHEYVRKLDIINRGYSGYNTRWGKELLLSILSSTTPNGSKIKVITVFLGANDSVLPGNRQYVPLEEFSNNLIGMVHMIQQFDSDIHIILITPPPVDPIRWSQCKDKPIDRNIENTRKYRDICIQVAQQLHVPCVDTWKVFLGPELECNSSTTKEILSDGLHFDKKGNELLARALIDLISKEWPDLISIKLPCKVAWHDQVDLENIHDSIFLV